MLSGWIVDEGWRAVQAEDGEMALEKLRAESVQVALIDLVMPGLDGLQLLARMQTENIQADVVMISGYGTIAVAVEAIKRGAHDFIEKPFRKSDVVSLVRDLFESHHPTGQNLVTRLDRFVMRPTPTFVWVMSAFGFGYRLATCQSYSRTTMVKRSGPASSPIAYDVPNS